MAWRATIAAAACVALGACAGNPAQTPRKASFLAGECTTRDGDADRPIALADLLPPAGSESRHAVVSGSDAGREYLEAVRASDEGLVREEIRDGRVVERMHLVRAADGSLALREVESFDDDSRSLFAQPLPFAADLAAGDALEGRSPMEVRTISSGRLRAKGTGSRTLRVVGTCEVSCSGERMRATVVELRFTAALDAAKADVVSRLYLVEGRGIVAEERRERRVILGILPSSRDETTVLLGRTTAADLR